MSHNDEQIAIQCAYETVLEMLIKEIIRILRENEKQKIRLAELTNRLEVYQMA